MSIVAVLAVPTAVAGVPGPFWRGVTAGVAPAAVNASHQIRHIVVLMLENHAYDTYFGTYCRQTGPFCTTTGNGIAPGTCILLNPTNASQGCVRPFNFQASNYSLSALLPHTWQSSHSAYYNGTNANFYLAEGSGLTPFGHYNGSTAPIYWDLAEEYGLGDAFFSPALSYSLPNHWYLVAGGTPPPVAQGSVGPGPHGTPLPPVAQSYLNQSNHTASAEDLFASHNLSWRFYDFHLLPYGTALTLAPGPDTASVFDYWNPEAAKAESYNASFAAHFVNRSAFFADAHRGTLPSVSWVIPSFNDSDHPPESVVASERYTASVVDALETSPEWSSTALFVTWDEYGGFYDHVVPPTNDANGWGFRVPLLVVSPFTPPMVISHANGSFPSILHFIEWRFGLGCLTTDDCNASLPLQFFNFSMTPRAPIVFPTNISRAQYPEPLQTTRALVLGGGMIGMPDPRSFDGTIDPSDLRYMFPGD